MLADEEFKNVDIVTKLGGAVLNNRSADFTDIFSEGDDFNYEYDVTIPSFAPSGTYEVTFTLKNTDDVAVGCIDTTFSL
jgi:hypothetical protein